MNKRKKLSRRKPIVFEYRSSSPFTLTKSLNSNALKISNDLLKEENEWKLEYELIYRSHLLER